MTLGFAQIRCVRISMASRPINRSALQKTGVCHKASLSRFRGCSESAEMFLLEGLMVQVWGL